MQKSTWRGNIKGQSKNTDKKPSVHNFLTEDEHVTLFTEAKYIPSKSTLTDQTNFRSSSGWSRFQSI